jgi:hypothetical protein
LTDVLIIEETETDMLVILPGGGTRRVPLDQVAAHIVETKTKKRFESSGATRVQPKKNSDSSASNRRPPNMSGRRRVHAFMDGDGIPVFTNLPQKYYEPPYEELEQTFEPIKLLRPLNSQQNALLRQALTRAASAQNERRRLSPRVYSIINTLIQPYAKQYGVRPELVKAVIKAESNFVTRAVSRKGAQGLMQLMPRTAQAMRVTDPFDPEQNIAGGTQYLGRLLGMFNGNERLAVAAYNAGPGRVKKYGGVPPFPETANYVTRVFRFVNVYKPEFEA